MMRAVRFAGQLGFSIESDTFNAIRTLKANLERVAVERMKVEFEKMILSPHRTLAFKALWRVSYTILVQILKRLKKRF